MNGIPILHSGSEFREGTLLTVTVNEEETKEIEEVAVDDSATSWKFTGRRVTCELTKHEVTSL